MQDLMPPVNTPDKLFHDGDPTQGIEGTIVTAEWLNDSQGAIRDVQHELINVLAGADILPNPDAQSQLLTAIQKLISTAVADAKYVPDVGELYITRSQIDPNVKWPETTWEYLGEGLTLRTAKADFSDLGSMVGADSITLTANNIPSHTHTIGGSTGNNTATSATTGSFDYGSKTSGSFDYGTKTSSSFDYGTKTTSNAGAHTHPIKGKTNFGTAGNNVAMAQNGTDQTNSAVITSAGAHTHTVAIGAHSHTVTMGAHTHSVAIGAHTHTVTIPAHNHSLPSATGSTGSGAALSVLQKSVNVAVWVRTS